MKVKVYLYREILEKQLFDIFKKDALFMAHFPKVATSARPLFKSLLYSL
jgi:hypothetical protein